MSSPAEPTALEITTAMREWLEKAVIGLNLCPFAKAVHVRKQIRYVVSEAQTEAELAAELRTELLALQAADPALVETTLLIHPRVLRDFGEFNNFHDEADAALEELNLVGEIQVASFHPDFAFAGTEPDDITNFTNRAPYPTLHLLREASVERALEAYPEPEKIYEANLETMRRLGPEGWRQLWQKDGGGASPSALPPETGH